MPVEPHWTTYVQAFSTPLVALIAGGIASMIAYRQWQTAKEKVVLDLFEKRLEIYNLVYTPTLGIITHGVENIDEEITGPFVRGLLKSKFLFGPEIYNHLEDIWRTINLLRATGKRRNDRSTNDELDKSFAKEDELMPKIIDFHNRFDDMVYPYLRMDAKLAQPNAARRWLSCLLPRRFRQRRKP